MPEIAPAAAPGKAGAKARPLVGPVVSLTSEVSSESDELLGGNARSKITDAVATKVLVNGEAMPVPAGRADDFAWPRRAVAPVGADPVVATTDLPMTPMVAETSMWEWPRKVLGERRGRVLGAARFRENARGADQVRREIRTRRRADDGYRFGAPSRHTATGKQSQVLVAAVNRHMSATPAWGNQPRIEDANEVTIFMRQLTRSTKNMAKALKRVRGMIASRGAQASPADPGIKKAAKVDCDAEIDTHASLIRSRLPEAGVAGMWRFRAAIST